MRVRISKMRPRINPLRLESIKRSYGESAYEFSQNTTLNAWRFIGDRHISIFERVFFLIAFICASALALNFIFDLYQKWSATPVIISNSASASYISQIPFPAVTICNMNQAVKSRVSSMNRTSPNYSILQVLCNRQHDIETTNVSSKWNDFEEFIFQSTQPCHRMLMFCMFGSKPFNCTDLFTPVLTDEGLCCAFNTVESKQMFKNASDHVYTAPKSSKYVAVPWTPESGYPKALPNDYYPAAAIGTGYSMGLTVILNAEIAEYYCSSTNGAGFKFLLHSPVETAEVGDNGFSLQAGHETRAVISPIVSEATDTIRDLSQRDRQCLFNSEIDLSYFKTYSQRNCELECEARQIAERCKCIMHYMPRVIPEIAICSVRDMPCVQAADGKAQIANQNGNNCSQDCIAACFDITYYVKTFSAPILRGAFALKHNALQRVPRDYAEKNLAVAHFYYTYNSFRSRVRQQYVGFTDVLSNTGGLMGLFVGFSVISVVEVLYYGTLRPYCVSRKESSQAKHTPAVKTRTLQIKRRKFWAHNISNPAVRNEILKSNGWQK